MHFLYILPGEYKEKCLEEKIAMSPIEIMSIFNLFVCVSPALLLLASQFQ